MDDRILKMVQKYLVKGRRMVVLRFITWGAIGAAIYVVVRGVRNGTFQQLMQNILNKLNVQNLQQMTQPLQDRSD